MLFEANASVSRLHPSALVLCFADQSKKNTDPPDCCSAVSPLGRSPRRRQREPQSADSLADDHEHGCNPTLGPATLLPRLVNKRRPSDRNHSWPSRFPQNQSANRVGGEGVQRSKVRLLLAVL